ncbi:MAG: acyl-CoA dehydrogenase family protein [Woeseiaceae bacterium]|nr:acyl-CoA dehydrogenase family protein [Woeseiaceae bacterium]
MDIELAPQAREWQTKAREYADDYLLSYEVEAELNGGVLPADIARRNKARAVELGFSGMDVPEASGGHALSIEAQVAVWEQLGALPMPCRGALPSRKAGCSRRVTEYQQQKYVLPLMHGTKHDCYAITEEGPGSDVSSLKATAVRDGDDYVLNGEKWFVTGANLADYFWFQARLQDEDDDTLFFIDQGTPGIEVIASPSFSHTFAAHHPTYRLYRCACTCRQPDRPGR